MRNPRSGKGLVGGLLIIGIGIIFLLDQQHIVSAGQVFRIFWPAFFIVLGLEDLIGGYNVRKRTWGATLVAGGSLLLLNQLGSIHVQIGLLWPLILIVVGLWLLLQNFGYGGMGPYPPWSHRSHYSWHHGRGGPGGPGGPFDPQNPPQGPPSVPPAGSPPAGTPEGGTSSSGFQPPLPDRMDFKAALHLKIRATGSDGTNWRHAGCAGRGAMDGRTRARHRLNLGGSRVPSTRVRLSFDTQPFAATSKGTSPPKTLKAAAFPRSSAVSKST